MNIFLTCPGASVNPCGTVVEKGAAVPEEVIVKSKNVSPVFSIASVNSPVDVGHTGSIFDPS